MNRALLSKRISSLLAETSRLSNALCAMNTMDLQRYPENYELLSTDAALRMLDTLEKEILSLSTLPNRVTLTEEEPWHSAGIRKLPVKNYLVYFWVNEEQKQVQITAVVYGRRDQRNVLQNIKYE